jgi:hypothetical protein
MTLPRGSLHRHSIDFNPARFVTPVKDLRKGPIEKQHTAKKFDQPMLKHGRSRDFIESNFYLGYQSQHQKELSPDKKVAPEWS